MQEDSRESSEMATIFSYVELGICLIICLGAALFGALFVPGEWYEQLSKPSWTPPDSIFPPVWTILYLMMGVAVWLVWQEKNRGSVALWVFIAQLILNAAWSWLFFGLKNTGLAFFDALILMLAIFTTAVLFWRENRLAGIIMIPYFLWASFAAALSFAIWQLNIN